MSLGDSNKTYPVSLTTNFAVEDAKKIKEVAKQLGISQMALIRACVKGFIREKFSNGKDHLQADER